MTKLDDGVDYAFSMQLLLLVYLVMSLFLTETVLQSIKEEKRENSISSIYIYKKKKIFFLSLNLKTSFFILLEIKISSYICHIKKKLFNFKISKIKNVNIFFI